MIRSAGARRWIRGLRVFPLLLALWACEPSSGSHPDQRPEVPVRTAVAVQKDVPLEVTTVGAVEAFAVVNVTSRIDGQIMAVHFTEGESVKRGQLLFTIDQRPYQAALEQAQANLEHDRIRAANAAADARRFQELVARDFVTRSQYEKARSEAEALAAAVKADAAAVAKAQLDLAYCRIGAPIEGRTGSLLVNAGNLVKANDSRPLVVLHQLHPVFVRFAVPEIHLPTIQRAALGSPPTVRLLAPDPAAGQEGRLSFVDNRVDPATGSISLKATFENHGDLLWPGQFVQAALVLGIRPAALVVPSGAVQMGQQGDYVVVVNADRTVTPHPVVCGVRTNGETVIESGLEPNATVVVDGHLRLFPGARVRTPDSPPAAGNRPS